VYDVFNEDLIQKQLEKHQQRLNVLGTATNENAGLVFETQLIKKPSQ
jgi:hypothetical protein